MAGQSPVLLALWLKSELLSQKIKVVRRSFHVALSAVAVAAVSAPAIYSLVMMQLLQQINLFVVVVVCFLAFLTLFLVFNFSEKLMRDNIVLFLLQSGFGHLNIGGYHLPYAICTLECIRAPS